MLTSLKISSNKIFCSCTLCPCFYATFWYGNYLVSRHVLLQLPPKHSVWWFGIIWDPIIIRLEKHEVSWFRLPKVPLNWIYCKRVLEFMNLSSTLLTCFKYFQPVYLLGNKASIPRSAYFVLTNKRFHTHESAVEISSKRICPWKSVCPPGHRLFGFKRTVVGNIKWLDFSHCRKKKK